MLGVADTHSDLAEATLSAAKPAEVLSEDESDDGGEELAYREAWSSSRSGVSADPNADATPLAGRAAQLKHAGNAAFAAGDWDAAVQHYTDALRAARLEQPEGGRAHTAALLSNRAAAHLRAGQPLKLGCTKAGMLEVVLLSLQAAMDAEKAADLAPSWPKPLFRWAQALAAMRHWEAAVARARAGEALSAGRHGRSAVFEALLDGIAIDAALAGSDAGFDGRHLEVRPAGEDAWLGGAAPEDPDLDGVGDGGDLVTDAGFSLTGGAAVSGSEEKAGASGAGALSTVRQRTSFRSVKQAVAAARDGDQILLLAGIHNGMGEAVDVDMRVLIHGQAALGEARIDQRANAPAFRLRRTAVLRNVDIDMTGFREALLVEGGPGVKPFVQRCVIRCSGDDGVNVCGSARPIFHDCTIQGRKAGVRAFDRALAQLQACSIEDCGRVGAAAMEQARLTLQGCEISSCGEEGVLAMQSATLTLQDCTITKNKGPAVDVSGGGKVLMNGGRVAQNVGGVLAWDMAALDMRGVRLEGGVWTALLVDEAASATVEGCRVEGAIHATDAFKAGLYSGCNILVPPDDVAATSLPPDDGTFVFTPDPYTRKQ